jgi:NitT/TauT family transport system substrate-binding protein
MMKSNIAAALAAVAAFVTITVASAADLPTIKIEAVKGSVGAVPLMIMVEEGFDKKHGFKAEIDYLPLGSGFKSFLMGQYDISNDTDAIHAATARAEGFDINAFYPYGNLYMGIVVSGKSDAKTVSDLKGKRVGHFGLQTSTTTYVRQLVQQTAGFDLTKQFDLQQVGPAALVLLLQSGDIAAMLNFEPFVSAAMVATNGRYLLQATEGFKAANDGSSPWFGLFVASNKWLTSNPKLAYAFRDAVDDAMAKLKESRYQVLKEPYIASRLGVTSPEVLDQMVKNAAQYDYFTNEWTPALIAKGYDYLKAVAKEGVLLKEVPDKTLVRLEDVVGSRQ